MILQAGGLVFPTHVGVFPITYASGTLAPGLPHACGGVSMRQAIYRLSIQSSPRMWGCFYRKLSEVIAKEVFPTHVGVFPRFRPPLIGTARLPHACGGVSIQTTDWYGNTRSSPRMWGCFSPDRAIQGSIYGLPHACGGVSVPSKFLPVVKWSSPRMWGCFHREQASPWGGSLFPTHVGVFPGEKIRVIGVDGLPHACGGVSTSGSFSCSSNASSPRMWGCFRLAFSPGYPS